MSGSRRRTSASVSPNDEDVPMISGPAQEASGEGHLLGVPDLRVRAEIYAVSAPSPPNQLDRAISEVSAR